MGDGPPSTSIFNHKTSPWTLWKLTDYAPIQYPVCLPLPCLTRRLTPPLFDVAYLEQRQISKMAANSPRTSSTSNGVFNPRPILMSILIIDDDTDNIPLLVEFLNRAAPSIADDAVYWPNKAENPLVLNFVHFLPLHNEAAVDFESRLRATLSSTNRPPGLFLILIDLYLYFRNQSQQLSPIDLAKQLGEMFPHIGLGILTGQDPSNDPLVKDNRDIFSVFQRKDTLDSEVGQKDLIQKVTRLVREKYNTPYWQALKQVVSEGTIALHALANTGSRTSYASTSVDHFSSFFGYNYFASEISATAMPLDSAHNPTGSIAKAEEGFALAFGAEYCRFVTGGTSASNKIVLQTILADSDKIIVDRNCHISHHHAIGLSRAQPLYIDPYYLPDIDIAGAVAITDIVDSLEALLGSSKLGNLPRSILVTNCTFDGIILDIELLFTKIALLLQKYEMLDRLRDLWFVVDEAWFGFSRFHPTYSRYSALNARHRLCQNPLTRDWAKELSLFVTQSTHKTLSSFRQASVILGAGPYFPAPSFETSVVSNRASGRASREFTSRLSLAYHTHVTTSPHVGMLASLDVGRRQALLEGHDLIDNAIEVSNEFRASINLHGANSDRFPFTALDDQFLLPPNLRAEGYQLDRTKVTLFVRDPTLSGKQMRSLLWEKSRIQVNRYSRSSILCMFMIGSNRQQLGDLLDRLTHFARVGPVQGTAFTSTRPLPSAAMPSVKANPIKGYLTNEGVGVTFKTAQEYAEALRQGKIFDPGAAFLSRRFGAVYHLRLTTELAGLLKICEQDGQSLLAAADFVTPYPPGYPILVPGQLLDSGVISEVVRNVNEHGEIHGVWKTADGHWMRVFKPANVNESLLMTLSLEEAR